MPPHGENCGSRPTVDATDTHGGSKAWSWAQVVGRGRLMPPHGENCGSRPTVAATEKSSVEWN